MKLNEVIVEGIGDALRTGMYKATGLGGAGAKNLAIRSSFVNNFKQQMKLNQQSAQRSGMPMDMNAFVDSYLAKYKWQASPQQKAQLEKITDPDKLANAMYVVGSQQVRNRQGNAIGAAEPAAPQPKGGQYNQPTISANLSPEDDGISVSSKQLMQAVNQLDSKDNADDLRAIIKTGLRKLYGIDKVNYAKLAKEIMTGQKAPDVQAAEPTTARVVPPSKPGLPSSDEEAKFQQRVQQAAQQQAAAAPVAGWGGGKAGPGVRPPTMLGRVPR